MAKLVRNLIPDAIRKSGRQACTLEARGVALKRLLAAKVVEEAMELFHAELKESAIEEMADVVTAVRALAEQCGVTLDEVERAVSDKASRRGTFSQGTVLLDGHSIDAPRFIDTLAQADAILPRPFAEDNRLTCPLMPSRPGAIITLDWRSLGVSVDVTYGTESIGLVASRASS